MISFVNLGVISHKLDVLDTKMEVLMAGQAELQAKVDEALATVAQVGSDLDAALARVASDVDFLKKQVSPDLQPQINSLDAMISDVKAASAKLKGLDPVPSNP